MYTIVILYSDALINEYHKTNKVDLSDYDIYDDADLFSVKCFDTLEEKNTYVRALDDHDWAINYAIVADENVIGLDDEDEDEGELKTYEVTYYYHTNCTVRVKAHDEDEAIELGYNEECDDQILGGLQEDGSPDCVEVED